MLGEKIALRANKRDSCGIGYRLKSGTEHYPFKVRYQVSAERKARKPCDNLVTNLHRYAMTNSDVHLLADGYNLSKN
jgi:hypothetical protein